MPTGAGTYRGDKALKEAKARIKMRTNSPASANLLATQPHKADVAKLASANDARKTRENMAKIGKKLGYEGDKERMRERGRSKKK